MATKIITTLLAVAALAVAALAASPFAGAATDVRLATLHGSAAFPNATGKAKSSLDDGIRTLEVEVQHVRALAGTRVVVRVDGERVGRMRVNALGHAEKRFQGSAVPRVTADSRIAVRRASNGRLVASGGFN